MAKMKTYAVDVEVIVKRTLFVERWNGCSRLTGGLRLTATRKTMLCDGLGRLGTCASSGSMKQASDSNLTTWRQVSHTVSTRQQQPKRSAADMNECMNCGWGVTRNANGTTKHVVPNVVAGCDKPQRTVR